MIEAIYDAQTKAVAAKFAAAALLGQMERDEFFLDKLATELRFTGRENDSVREGFATLDEVIERVKVPQERIDAVVLAYLNLILSLRRLQNEHKQLREEPAGS